MKYVAIVSALCLIGVLCLWQRQAVAPTTDTAAQPERGSERVDATDLGMAFSYPTGSAGYVLMMLEGNSTTDPRFVRQYTLVTPETVALMERDTEATEFPPSMAVAVYKRSGTETVDQWVVAHPEFSNMTLQHGELDRTAQVGGVPALRYLIDGLYPTTMIVVTSGQYVFLFSGAFLTADDRIVADFAALVDSVRFTAGQ